MTTETLEASASTKPEPIEDLRLLGDDKVARPHSREDALFAVRFAGKDKGYWPAKAVRPHQTPLANPTEPWVDYELKVGERIPLEQAARPTAKVIGVGMLRGWFVFFDQEIAYEDARAAALVKRAKVVDVKLWCPVRWAPGGASEEHGAYVGISQKKDIDRFTAGWNDNYDYKPGACPNCQTTADVTRRRMMIAKLNQEGPE